MVVLINWSHQVLPTLKMLLVITRVSKSMRKSIGGKFLFSPLYFVMYFLIVGSPSEGSMFVYMEVASEVKR